MKPENKNLSNFVDAIKNLNVSSIDYLIDENPTFDKNLIPFEFEYCFAIVINADSKSFRIYPSQTDDGLETLWMQEIEQIESQYKREIINKKIETITVENSKYDLPYKLHIAFENQELIFYCGEIYDDWNDKLNFKINDEMILAFDNSRNAKLFEHQVNNR